jgi:glycogen operon protein
VDKNTEMLRFVKAVIAFRRLQPNVRRPTFLTGTADKPGHLPDISWYGTDGKPVDWHQVFHSLTAVLGRSGLNDVPEARPVMIMLHSGAQPQPFAVPKVAAGRKWRLFVDTAAESPGDVYPAADGPPPPKSGPILLDHHSLRCYVAD